MPSTALRHPNRPNILLLNLDASSAAPFCDLDLGRASLLIPPPPIVSAAAVDEILALTTGNDVIDFVRWPYNIDDEGP